MSSKERLVSARTLWDGLKRLEQEAEAEAPFRPDFAAKLVERTLLEVRRVVREAEAEYVSTGRAQEITGWDAGTLRKYAALVVTGKEPPRPWQALVAKREGRDYALLLSTIPAKPTRMVA